MASREGEGVVRIVPALTVGTQGYPPQVGAEVTCGVDSNSRGVSRRTA